MITRTPKEATVETGRALWQLELGSGIRGVGELLQRLDLRPEQVGWTDESVAAADYFPLRVPTSFIDRMRPGDPADPLLLQVLPVGDEMLPTPGWSLDPLAEAPASPVPGLLHKYCGRVLLITTGACAVHCRYCFRRHFPYAEHRVSDPDFDAALDYVAADPTIREVILSGGDPLSLPDTKLARLTKRLEGIAHVERLRIHTRLPVVLPTRVDEALLTWLTSTRLRPVIVLHVNHGNEIDAEFAAWSRRLLSAGVPLLNQAVFLRGINDSVEAQRDLSERLFSTHVMPYYLHILDRVEGAAHFAVEEETARGLIRSLSQQLPGYLVPRLVREDAGALAKTLICP
ncbi:MAG: EF-P beta-lysylation protein EpmB [Thermoanaerobaculia bacterium]|nr:EF-P beta-lysylation protein EpmB [Thermoanaerobaculia bacterium]